LPNSNYFVWHYTQALPDFIKSRLDKFSQAAVYFNLGSLVKNLFSPYKRMTLANTAPGNIVQKFIDRVSFDLISRAIGAIARIIFLIIGAFGLIAFVIFDLVTIILYLLPIFSLPGYFHQKNQFILDNEAKNPKALSKKLLRTPYVKTLSSFFDEEFISLFEKEVVIPQNAPLNPRVENIVDFLFKNSPSHVKYLENKSVKPEDFQILEVAVSHHLNPQKPHTVTPLGGLLTFGYTNTLDQFSARIYPAETVPTPNTQKLIETVEKILVRTQNNNIIIVGEPGVGRHTTLNYLAQALGDPQNKGLFGKKLLMLDTVAIAGRGGNLEQIKSIFEDILEEAKTAGGIILAIDQVDRIVSARDERIDISQVITLVLKEAALPIIGISTIDDFNEFIRPNTNFLKYFEKLEVEEPDEKETLGILIDKIIADSNKAKITVTLPALLELIDKSESMIPDQKQPAKSLTLLEDAISAAQDNKKPRVDVAAIDELLAAKTKTPLGQIGKSEANKLKELENGLHRRIVGQNEAINELGKAMRRARSGIENGKRPIGSFLFLGPTGVGKTETAKALAESYFGSEEKMVRLDMSEFQDQDALDRLIGDSKSKNPGQLTNLIRQNPYGLLLVDEFEKANSAAHNIFLQILDEGFLTDAFGKKVSFDNVIVIATSNAGAEYIRERVEKGHPPTSKELMDYILEKGIFSPELVNRFDGVIVYTPLTQEEATAITNLMLSSLSAKLKETKNITLEITPELCQKVAQKGYDEEFGARPIRRLIQDKIEDEIARMLIDKSIKSGSVIPTATLLASLS
ncbi:MAG: AAA family ATPase, partial [Candidatus Curtissbacteria bacterium]